MAAHRPFRTLLVNASIEEARHLEAILAREARLERPPFMSLEQIGTLDDAVTRIREGKVDVVLLDLSEDLSEGGAEQKVERVRRLHDAGSHVAVVVLTRSEDDPIAMRAVLEGAQDSIVKGHFDRDLLDRVLRYAVERKRAEANGRRLLLERGRRVQAEAVERRATFLAEAGSRLASVLDFDEVPRRVVDLAVPILADGCVVDLLLESGEIARVASAGASRETTAVSASLLCGPLATDAHPVKRALASGRAVLLSDVTDAFLKSISPSISGQAISQQPETPRTHRPRSLMTVPLLARGRTLGAITFVSGESGHVYGTEDLAFAWALSDRAALAMDNAKLFRAREEMLSIVSHDLRNPLNVITVGLASLKRGVPEERRTLFLEKIRRAADRMNRLIEDLLDVTRLESGSLALDREAHVPAPIVSDAFDLLRPQAEEKAIHLVLDVEDRPGHPLPAIYADRERILQILGNLLGNAIKFTPASGTIEVSVRTVGEMVRFSVIDSGPGIPKIDQTRIFDRYFQVRRNDRRGGSGLGLAIAKGLVQAHGGDLTVESEHGEGATFDFTIPCAREPAEDASQAEEPSPKGGDDDRASTL